MRGNNIINNIITQNIHNVLRKLAIETRQIKYRNIYYTTFLDHLTSTELSGTAN